jgi:hypothetical protein
MVMPWGKYRGRHIMDVPAGYLGWLLEECASAPAYLLDAAQAELGRRYGTGERATCPRCSRAEAVVLAWYRKAARRCHPDTGGSEVAMRLLNDLRDEVLAALR